MAKGKRAKGRKNAAGPPRDRRAARLEKALTAGLRREAKAASRLEAAQLEVAVLRAALVEVLGEAAADAPVGATFGAASPSPAKAAGKAATATPATARTGRPRPAADR